MASIDLPAEIWSRIFFYVAPPLPFVGLEHESYAEDAKGWRGDELFRGRWRDIDSLMLVSKRLNELVSPVFWSFLVFTSSEGLTTTIEVMKELEDVGRKVLSFPKVVVLPESTGVATAPSSDWCRDALADLRALPNVVHVHVQSLYVEADEMESGTSLPLLVSLQARPSHCLPLEGLTGLVLTNENFDAAMLVLDKFRTSLRRLSISSIDGSDAAPSIVWGNIPHDVTTLPALISLDTGTRFDHSFAWLETALDFRCEFPALVKISRRLTHPNAYPARNPDVVQVPSGYHSRIESLGKACLMDLARDDAVWRSPRLREVAVGFGSNAVHMPVSEFLGYLRHAKNGGQSAAVQSIVVIEANHQRTDEDGYDQCLIELVGLNRFPNLKRVVWISAIEEMDKANWSGLLVRWTHTLIRAGIELDIQ